MPGVRAKIEDYKFELMPSGWVMVSCTEKVGVHILAFKYALSKAAFGKFGDPVEDPSYKLKKHERGPVYQFRSKKGVAIDPQFFKGNGLQFKATEEEARGLLAHGIMKANADHESRENWKASEPERKRTAAQEAAAERKKTMAAYDELYGKGTWNRVTYRQENGDDGYGYVMRVDGRIAWDGMQLREARWRKENEVVALAKREKLGKYAETE